MGSIVMVPSDVRFGVMYKKEKRIVSRDGYVYAFGEAPEETYSFDIAMALYNLLISEGNTDETITLFAYSFNTINDDREPYPVDEAYYTRDRMFGACYPELKDYTLVSENH